MANARAARRREWLLAHRGIGSSQAAACLGLDPYTTKAEVYDEIVTILNGQLPPDGPDPMGHRDRGVWLEPVGLGLYQERFEPARMTEHGELDTCGDPEHPELIATPDGMAWYGDDSAYAPVELVEVKWPTPENFERIVGYGLGASWLIQGQHQLGIYRDVPRVCYMLCTGPAPWRQRPLRVDRHEAFISDTLRPGLLQFWQRHVAPRVRPVEKDEGPEAGVADALPVVPGEVLISNDPRLVALCDALDKLDPVEAAVRERREAITTEIQGMMAAANADVVEVPGRRKFSWRWSRPTYGYDFAEIGEHVQKCAAVAVEYPELVESHGLPPARTLGDFRTAEQKRKRPFNVRHAK